MTASSPKHDVFQAIADPTRRGLLKLLAGRELPVAALCQHFPISRTAVSKHLRILSDAGLVKERKSGRETRYRLEPGPLQELKRWLAFYEIFWDNRMAAPGRYVESGTVESGTVESGTVESRKPEAVQMKPESGD